MIKNYCKTLNEKKINFFLYLLYEKKSKSKAGTARCFTP